MRSVPLVGPSYNLESRPASVQRTINMMPVPLEPGNERTAWVLKDVPGLTLFEAPPPTDPDFDNVILLWHFNGAEGSTDLIDFSQYANPSTIGSEGGLAHITTVWAADGTGSFQRPATANSSASAGLNPYPVERRFGTSDFTVDVSYRKTSDTNFLPHLAIGQQAPEMYTLLVGELLALGRISAWLRLDNAAGEVKLDSPPGTLVNGTAYNICVQRTGDRVDLFVNGVSVANGTLTGDVDPPYTGSTGFITLGGGGATYQGQVDEVRMTRITSRYAVTGYTVTFPFPDA